VKCRLEVNVGLSTWKNQKVKYSRTVRTVYMRQNSTYNMYQCVTMSHFGFLHLIQLLGLDFQAVDFRTVHITMFLTILSSLSFALSSFTCSKFVHIDKRIYFMINEGWCYVRNLNKKSQLRRAASYYYHKKYEICQ